MKTYDWNDPEIQKMLLAAVKTERGKKMIHDAVWTEDFTDMVMGLVRNKKKELKFIPKKDSQRSK